MKTIETPLLDLLLADKAFSRVRKRDISNLLLHMHERVVAADEVLFENSMPADKVFLISKGRFLIDMPDERPVEKNSGFLGAEAALGAVVYRGSTRAAAPSSVVSLPADELSRVASSNPHLKYMLFESFAGKTAQQQPASPISMPTPEPAPSFVKGLDLIGWIVLLVLPFLIVRFALGLELQSNAAYFLAIIGAAATLWVFDLVPAFVPPLFSLLAVILFDIAPAQTALSGFTSGTFFMCMSIFGIGAILLNSGLAYRLMLKLMLWLPPSRPWYNFLLFSVGILMTPVIPSPAGRMAMISPILLSLLDSTASHKQQKIIATQFICSTISGVILLATVFMTGKPANLILYGLLDSQTQFAFQWLPWLVAASFAGVVLLVLYVIVFHSAFRVTASFNISKQIVAGQLKLLGAVHYREWGAVAALAVLGVGVLAAPFHKMEIPWLTLAIAVLLLLSGIMGRREFRNYIDWPLLLFIGAIIAWAPIMRTTGLTDIITDQLAWLSQFADNRFPMLIGMLCLLILIVRLVLPSGITVVLFATATFPIADAAGITPWILGFVILMMSEAHLFAYQNPFSLQLRNELIHRKLADCYDERRIVRFNILMIAGRIAAIYISLPFWKYLGIL